MNSRARRTFLDDQHAAAVDDVQTAFVAKAGQIGVTQADLTKAGQSGPAQAVLHRLVTGVNAGDIKPCDHLTADAPSKVHWAYPGRADQLMCFLCLVAYDATTDYTKLPDTGPCAACDTVTGTVHTFTLAAGPVLIAAVICGSCYAQTRSS